MILDWSKVRVFVKPGATDMRKQINGLSIIVSEDLEMDLFEGNLFLFCNKLRKILKIIYWDKTGFCLWSLRINQESLDGFAYLYSRNIGILTRAHYNAILYK